MSVERELDDAFLSDEAQAIPSLLPEGPDAARRAVSESPERTNMLMDEVDDADVAEAARSAPDTVDEVQRLLWATHSEKVERYDVLKAAVETSVTVNYEATDSPMEGHMETDGDSRSLAGGPRKTDDPDLVLRGSSDVLAGLLTGSQDPLKSYERGEIEVDGSLSNARKLAEALRKITRRL